MVSNFNTEAFSNNARLMCVASLNYLQDKVGKWQSWSYVKRCLPTTFKTRAVYYVVWNVIYISWLSVYFNGCLYVFSNVFACVFLADYRCPVVYFWLIHLFASVSWLVKGVPTCICWQMKDISLCVWLLNDCRLFIFDR